MIHPAPRPMSISGGTQNSHPCVMDSMIAPRHATEMIISTILCSLSFWVVSSFNVLTFLNHEQNKEHHTTIVRYIDYLISKYSIKFFIKFLLIIGHGGLSEGSDYSDDR